jgi:hypothetical protein
MKNTGFQFNERDADIVHYVYQLQVATLDHLAALTNRSQKTLERRVPKLRDERYLRRLRPRPHKGLYVIGPRAVPILIENGYAPEDLRDKRLRENEWKDLTIPHRAPRRERSHEAVASHTIWSGHSCPLGKRPP